jgi:uncharacterized protein YegP (UPF0339 family)
VNRAVFEIKLHPVGRLYFVFRDSAGVSRITSKSFGSRASLERCIAGIRETAPLSEIGAASDARSEAPRFQVRESPAGFAFELIGFEGEIIVSSLFHETIADCCEALGRFKRESADAALLDSSYN